MDHGKLSTPISRQEILVEERLTCSKLTKRRALIKLLCPYLRYRCCAAVHQTSLIMIHGKIYTAIARNFLPTKTPPPVEMRLGESNGYAKVH